jgi:actin
VQFPFAGRGVTRWVQALRSESGLGYFEGDRFFFRDIKEKFGYVALDFEAELQKAATTDESNAVHFASGWDEYPVGSEAFRGPELLFKPSLDGLQYDGIDQVVFDTIQRSALERAIPVQSLYENIVLAGGSTTFPGFPERLEKEIVRRAPQDANVKVIAIPERRNAIWIGGAKLASSPTFRQLVVTRQEYNDSGPGVVHTKFA